MDFFPREVISKVGKKVARYSLKGRVVQKFAKAEATGYHSLTNGI